MYAHSHDIAAGADLGHVLLHTFQDALVDTLKMLPFLFVAYLIIELIERSRGRTLERILSKGGRWGFLPGALLGIVPQCGFSAMAANFYGSRVITLGTLLAVFIATSDEAIPIMLAQPDSYPAMLKLILAKLAFAIIVGFLIDVVLRKLIPASLRGGWGGDAKQVDCHHHEEGDRLIVAVLKHTVSIFLIVLAFTFAFGLLVTFLGEEQISHFLGGLGLLQPVAAGLFGLIPNCASSVLLTQLYLSGSISFGSVLAGLSTNAGIGLTVLFRANKSLKQNLFILGLLYVLGTAVGVAVHALGI